jgi:hypothetical protein
VRSIAVALVAALLAALVIGQATVEAGAGKGEVQGTRVWAGHPSVILEVGLAEVGRTTTEGRPVDKALITKLIHAAAKAPMAPEPYLVRGVEASSQGNNKLAGRAFLAARARDPRSIAARYFLADHYVRSGEIGPGLNEISALVRLLPQSVAGMAPYLAAYARNPEGTDAVRALLRKHPQLEPVVLQALAADPRDASLAISLWNGKASEAVHPWQNMLLETLIAAGRFDEANGAWSKFSGNKQETGPGRVNFANRQQGPFGWAYASGASGIAEAQGDAGLRLVYFGRDDLVLASRVMMLGPGRYSLSMTIDGKSSAEPLAWTIECLPSGPEIARLSLGGVSEAGSVRSTFRIPPEGCHAQRIRLTATATELSEKIQLTIGNFLIRQEGAK